MNTKVNLKYIILLVFGLFFVLTFADGKSPLENNTLFKKDVQLPPGNVIYNSKASSKRFVGSPSITILKDGTYLASHDIFGGIISYSCIYRSDDKGTTWKQICQIDSLTWAKLFIHGEEVYLLGIKPKCVMGYGDIVILRSKDSGSTWTSPTDSKTGLLRSGYYHTAPTPVVFHNGRLWKAMENQGEEYWGWGAFRSFIMSAKENADWLNASSWTFSNELPHVAGQYPSTTWLEGNAVVASDGSVKNVLRLDLKEDDRAAVVSVSSDGKTVSFDPQKDVIYFPGAGKKFTIRYDSISARYWTLSNYVLPNERTEGENLCAVRNTIVLACSEDLVHWNIKDTLLHHPDIQYHGFQYLDWQFDGDDIIAVSRTAWEDETGHADSQHNANYLTFHRFPNFRYERIDSMNNIHVARWYGNAESAFALTFDDGFKAHYDYTYPLLEKYNIHGTFYVNSNNLVSKHEKQAIGRYGFKEDFLEMSKAGHEIGSHSLTHPNMTAIGQEKLCRELEEDKKNIESFTATRCFTHAYPYCIHNEAVDSVMLMHFIAGRYCGGLANPAIGNDGKCSLINSDLLTWKYPRSLDKEKESFLELKEKINHLNGGFGVVCIHETLPFKLLHTSDTYEVATTEWLEKVCNYLSALRKQKKIWPAPLSEIVRYAAERSNLRVYKSVVSEDTIYYRFSTWLDPEVYNVPLTIECTLPADWHKVHYKIASDGTVVSEKVCSVRNGKLLLDIIPDKESVILMRK